MSDLIDRQAAIDAVRSYYDAEYCLDTIEELIEKLPSAQPHSNESSETQKELDCISRQAAIDSFCKHPNSDWTTLDVLAAMKALPSAQPESHREWYMKGYRDAQPRWIPCEERLPEEDGYYLVTGKKQSVYISSYKNGWWYGGAKPIAWMPRPEPWRGGQDEQVD